jgi:hypothetical protein
MLASNAAATTVTKGRRIESSLTGEAAVQSGTPVKPP